MGIYRKICALIYSTSKANGRRIRVLLRIKSARREMGTSETYLLRNSTLVTTKSKVEEVLV